MTSTLTVELPTGRVACTLKNGAMYVSLPELIEWLEEVHAVLNAARVHEAATTAVESIIVALEFGRG